MVEVTCGLCTSSVVLCLFMLKEHKRFTKQAVKHIACTHTEYQGFAADFPRHEQHGFVRALARKK